MEKNLHFREKKILNFSYCKLFVLLFLFACSLSAHGQDWIQMGPDIPGEAPNDKSGASIGLSNDGLTLAIGAPQHGNDNTGNVRVFNYTGTDWVLKGNAITGSPSDRYFGISLSLSNDGNRVAVCASYNEANPGNEEVKIYQWNGSSWEQLGNSLLWESLSVYYGSVKLSGNGETVAIGDMGNTTNGNNAGQVRIYTLNGSTWQQRGSAINGNMDDGTGSILDLSDDGNTFAANFGNTLQVYSWNGTDWAPKGNLFNGFAYNAVSLGTSGNIAVVSGESFANGNGAAQVYQWNGTSWDAQGALIEGEPGSGLGLSSSLSNNNIVLALGGPGANNGSGEARTYMFNGSNWQQVGNTIIGETNLEYCGYALSLNGAGNILALGSPTYLLGNYGLPERTRVFRNDDVLSKGEILLKNIDVYPNPSNGEFTIDLGKEYENITVQVSNLLGQIISSKNYKSAKTIRQTINTSSGTYFVKVSTAKEGSNTLRIIKQ